MKAWRKTLCLELIHANVCGPMSIESLSGSKYFLLFVDNFSRMCWVHFIKSKANTFECFQRFQALVKRLTRRMLEALWNNPSEESMSHEFHSYCEELGIRRELIARYTPQQNGVIEEKIEPSLKWPAACLRVEAYQTVSGQRQSQH